MITIAIIICIFIFLITGIICYTSVSYYSSENKRRITTMEENLHNLEFLLKERERLYNTFINEKEREANRIAEITKNILSKQSNYNIDASLKTGMKTELALYKEEMARLKSVLVNTKQIKETENS